VDRIHGANVGDGAPGRSGQLSARAKQFPDPDWSESSPVARRSLEPQRDLTTGIASLAGRLKKFPASL